MDGRLYEGTDTIVHQSWYLVGESGEKWSSQVGLCSNFRCYTAGTHVLIEKIYISIHRTLALQISLSVFLFLFFIWSLEHPACSAGNTMASRALT